MLFWLTILLSSNSAHQVRQYTVAPNKTQILQVQKQVLGTGSLFSSTATQSKTRCVRFQRAHTWSFSKGHNSVNSCVIPLQSATRQLIIASTLNRDFLPKALAVCENFRVKKIQNTNKNSFLAMKDVDAFESDRRQSERVASKRFLQLLMKQPWIEVQARTGWGTSARAISVIVLASSTKRKSGLS